MFTNLSSREESFEKFLSTFHLLAPHARIELNSGQSAFRWKGKFASTSGFSWWEVESEIDWTCRFAQQKERLGLVLPSAGTMSARIRNRTVAIDREYALALSVPDVSSISYSGRGKHGHVTLEFDVAAVQKTFSAIFEGAALQNIELRPQLDLASPAGRVLKALGEAVGAGMHDTCIRSEKSMALLGESILRLVFLNFPHGLSNRLLRHQMDATSRQIMKAVGSNRDQRAIVTIWISPVSEHNTARLSARDPLGGGAGRIVFASEYVVDQGCGAEVGLHTHGTFRGEISCSLRRDAFRDGSTGASRGLRGFAR